MKKDLQKAYFALALVSFFWGTTYVASRVGTQQMPGLFMALGILITLAGVFVVNREFKKVKR